MRLNSEGKINEQKVTRENSQDKSHEQNFPQGFAHELKLMR